MSDHTYKDLFGDGYTTYHEDGSTSHTYKDLFGDGTTTYHEDGTTSHTHQDLFGDGVTTYHSDGSSSHTYKDLFGDGTTTYHSDGSTSHTYKDFFGDGYTTYHEGGSSYGPGSYSSGSYRSATSSYSGDIGGYGGYGGFVGGGWNVSRIGVFGILLSALGLGAVGYATQWFMGSIEWPVAAMLVAAIVVGGVQRNLYRGNDRQTIWYRWCWILAILFAIITVQENYFVIGSIEFVGAVVAWPLAYLAAMFFILNYALQPLDDSGTLLYVALVMTPAMLLVANRYGNYEIYLAGNDLVFLVLALCALFTLRQSLKDCKQLALVFPVACVALYLVASRVTGFAGLPILFDAAVGLIERVLP